ncbi:MAG: hypothetical protein K6C97_00515 [Treponema sp.]|nr:hypothetical protein [Treponema sp.]
MGLLTKANLIDLNQRLAFSDFILKYKIKTFAIFTKKDNSFFVSNSLGLDGKSILESISTEDFWKGSCKNLNTVYNFNNSQKDNPLLQFFSFKIIDDIKSVSVVRKEDSIFLLGNQEITNDILADYSNLDFNTPLLDITKLNHLINHNSIFYKLEIDFDEAIQTYIYTKLNNKEYADDFSLSLFNELSNRIIFAYNSPDTSVKAFDNKIKSVFISNQPISKELLTNHLILNYTSVIDNAAEVINIEYCGMAETFNEIKDFLKVE